MIPTFILGPTGSGKTEALMQQYYRWIEGGARTDEILVLTSGAAQTSQWRKKLRLPAHGPIEAHSFFGFVQRELMLFWAPVQAKVPVLKKWVRPEFLNVEIAHHLMRGLVEPILPAFSDVVASGHRIAIQIASNLSTVAAASGLSPAETAQRLAAADRPEKAELYQLVQGLLESFREKCVQAGVLDYGLSLHLFTDILMDYGPYLDHLRGRYRYLLVDDLDESVPAEQDFVEKLSAEMEAVVFALDTDGGHSSFMGADAALALQRFRPGAEVVELEGSFTCSPEAFAFGGALARRIMGERLDRREDTQPKEPRYADLVEDWIVTDLRGDMISQVVDKVGALVKRGVHPGEIALISPRVEKALEVTARRVLEAQGIPVQNMSLSRRLVDEPYARAIITLAGLVHPHWRILGRTGGGAGAPSYSAASIANAMQLLLKLDPIRASILGDEIWRRDFQLPDLDETGLRRRIGFERAEAYEALRQWVQEAQEKAQEREWDTDTFAQAVVSEVMAPLVGDLSPATLHSCQQLLLSAHRFRLAMERFGEGAYGSEYIKMLTEGTVAAEPLQAYDPDRDAVTLATPYSYLSGRLNSQYQIWVDISGDGWYPNDVKELANPHVLSRRWEDGARWSDSRSHKVRQRNGARTARALVRRCRGRLILAECSLTPWGMDQEGGLAAAFGDLIRGGQA